MKLTYVALLCIVDNDNDTDVLFSSLNTTFKNLDTSDGFRHVGNFVLLIVTNFRESSSSLN